MLAETQVIDVRHWTYWEWIAYSGLFVAATIIAVDTGVRISPDLSSYVPAFVHGAIWGFAPLTLFIAATIILLVHELFFRPRELQVDVPIKTQTLTSPAKSSSIKEAIYVGNIQANTAALATEYLVELTVHAFNGSGSIIAVTDVEG
jgi:hypothetical protein